MRIVAVMRASRKPSEPCKVVGVYVRAFSTGSSECFTRPRADAGPMLAARSTAARRADDMAVPVRARCNADLLRSRSERATHAPGIPIHLAQAALRSGLQRASAREFAIRLIRRRSRRSSGSRARRERGVAVLAYAHDRGPVARRPPDQRGINYTRGS